MTNCHLQRRKNGMPTFDSLTQGTIGFHWPIWRSRCSLLSSRTKIEN